MNSLYKIVMLRDGRKENSYSNTEELEENMFIKVQDIYDIVSKHYERHKSLFLTRDVKSNDAFFYNFNCPESAQQLISAMNAMSITDEVQIKSIEAKLYDKKVSAFSCDDYMVKVSEHRSPNSRYISINFYGITGVIVKKFYRKYEAKLNYNPKHILSIYINARNGDLYGKGIRNSDTLYPMSFSSWVNKLLLHSEAFRDIFKDILTICSNGNNIIKDVVRTIEEEGYVAMPITIFDVKKYRTKNEMISGFSHVDLPIDFNKRSLNHGYLLAELSKYIPAEQVGYMIQFDKEMVVNTVRDIYKEIYPLENFSREFVVRYYINKLDLHYTRYNRMLIYDYIRLAVDHNLPISISFKTANRLIREHNNLARQYREEEMSAEISQPLIAENTKFQELRQILPEEFEWITTTGRLLKEGDNQDNCVFSYRDKIRNDRSTIYHWSHEGRDYTIEFGCRFDGKFTIEQMLQTRNGRANGSDVEYVKRCLGNRYGDLSERNEDNIPWYFGNQGDFDDIADPLFDDVEVPF